jgi:PAS domain S-box-containing protein
VTQAREVRDAMLRSDARYRNLVESATDAIFTVDARGLYSSANRATCLIMGHDRSDLLGRDFLGAILPEDLPSVTEHFRAALAGQSRRFECRIVRRGGERRTVSVTNTPIYHGADVVGVLGIARDVTLERERDEALVRSEARYARLVESASDGIFTVDDAGSFVSVNRSLERSVGRAARDLAGTSFVELVEPDDRESMREVFAGTMRGERRRAEMRFRDARGLLRMGSITMTPIVADGRVTGGLGVVRDVTEERRLSEQLLQREKLAAVGQLVSGVAHELNNPLAGIAAFSQLLLASGQASAEQQEALVTINKEARRAGKIVSNLLLFARQRHPERGLTDLNQVMLDTLELRRYVLHTAEIEVVTDLDPELPITWADPFQLQQVLLNLLTNAEHAVRAAAGVKRIVLRTRREGERLVASVEDSGSGIPRDILDRIFNPFFTTKPVGEGTGLGLSISDGIVREHGGQITVRTAPGQGATFDVELPLVPPPDARTQPLVRQAAASRSRTILVADHESASREALAQYLRKRGHRVDVVGTGGDALARLGHAEYDAILLDVSMPDMSGGEVYARIRERHADLADRVVFTTGHADGASDAVRALARPSVRKPFLLEDVATLLCGGTD